MRCGESGERSRRKGQATLPRERLTLCTIASALWNSAALAEYCDGIGLVGLAGGPGTLSAPNVDVSGPPQVFTY
jgi:hypothetical protein